MAIQVEMCGRQAEREAAREQECEAVGRGAGTEIDALRSMVEAL